MSSQIIILMSKIPLENSIIYTHATSIWFICFVEFGAIFSYTYIPQYNFFIHSLLMFTQHNDQRNFNNIQNDINIMHFNTVEQ